MSHFKLAIDLSANGFGGTSGVSRYAAQKDAFLNLMRDITKWLRAIQQCVMSESWLMFGFF